MSADDNAPEQAREVEALRRWKAETMPVLAGLQEVGQALGVQLGRQITSRETVDAALDLRNERDAAVAEAERVRASIAAERQEAAREAEVPCIREAAEAARRYPGFGVHASTFAHWLDLYAEAIERDRADGVTGRSGT